MIQNEKMFCREIGRSAASAGEKSANTIPEKYSDELDTFDIDRGKKPAGKKDDCKGWLSHFAVNKKQN